MEDLKERFWNRKAALESKSSKVNIRKTKVVAGGRKKNYSKARQIHVEFVGGESWPIQYCAQNVKTGFTEDARK